jgi:hypothetical protein
MARSKLPLFFASPSWIQSVRKRFLDFAAEVSPAIVLLATAGRTGCLSSRAWAEQYGVSGTWVECWAADALDAWRSGAIAAPRMQGEFLSVGYPLPRLESTVADQFNVILTGQPAAQMPNPWREIAHRDEQDQWLAFCDSQHKQLDKALEEYRRKALENGGSREIKRFSDLNLHLETAALYVFAKARIEDLCRDKAISRDRTVVFRNLKYVLEEILGLRMRRPGRMAAGR